MKSWSKPTHEQVDAAISRLIHVGQIRYFFDRLENPNWVKPLWQKGFFRNPPPSVPGERENTIAFPIWPESKFLARMAEHVPDLICEIIKKMPSTENARVLEDFMDASLAMPVPISMQLLPKIRTWHENPYHFLFYEKLAELIASFAEAGQTKPALDLAKMLFAITLSPSKKSKLSDGSEIEMGRGLVARMDSWHYEQALKKCIPSLTSVAGIDTLRLLCSLTEDTIRPRDSRLKRDDYSTMWRPAVEDHEQNAGHTLKDTLIDAVRDTAIRIVSKNPKILDQVLKTLEQRPYTIFSRIALHVLAEIEVTEPKAIAQRLLSRELFDSSRHRHEYAHLLRVKFESLNETGQSLIVKWIEDGPDISSFQESMRDSEGRPPTEGEVQRYSNLWKRDRVSWFLENAPQHLRAIYDHVVATEGEPEHADFSSFQTSWVGPISPKTDEELRQYEFDELIEYLRNWRPTNEWQAPSREGLTRILETLVAEKYKEFSEKADRLKELPAIYLRAVISGLTSATSEDPTLNWAITFELCDWILAQQDEADSTAVDDENVQLWQSVRQAVARLLEKGFIENRIPLELREQVWVLIKLLTDDPDPTLEHETRYVGDNFAPWDMALNTVRGVAFHALIQYGLWCLRASKGGDEGEALAFSGTPEVTEVLERHLDTSVDPSSAIRSVYGQFFPWIMLLDHEWAKANVGRIFPSAKAAAPFWNAGWGGYVLFVPPFDDVLDVLVDQYVFAIELLTEVEKQHRRDRESERLSGHLMTYYWRGKLDSDGGKALLERFWQKAPPETRSAALRFIGISLKNTKHDLPEEIRRRLITLWESRMRAIIEADEKDRSPVELGEFGWWFASGALPDDWALDQLSQVLSLTTSVERERDTLTNLVSLFGAYPHKTAEIFEKLVNGTEKTWGLSLIREGVREMLRRMLEHEDRMIVEKARDLVNWLGARGHLEFRDLLKSPGLTPQ